MLLFRAIVFCVVVTFLAYGVFSFSAVRAETIGDKIVERNQAIRELEKEIENYQNQIETVGKETRTLQNAIKSIDLEQKKFLAEIRVTESKTTAITLRIEELTQEIGGKELRIEGNREAIAQSLRSIDEAERETLVEMVLSHRAFSSFWEQLDALGRFQESVRLDLADTKEVKSLLESRRAETEKNRKALLALKVELSDQTQLLAQNKKAKNSLLTSTKNREVEYKRILDQKVALRNAFEQELLAFESELRFQIDPTSLPKTGSGVLKWPLDAVKITQHFGDTEFARSGAYNGRGHNGIDLRATTGTAIRASLSGTIKGAGNTDSVCPGASYGKWVLIEHSNGLSTLYSHLSLIKVVHGQSVGTGEVIGYSGETGYATGPHLHFTVYATQGVRVMQRKSAVCGGTYTMPIADLKAYLDPLKYL